MHNHKCILLLLVGILLPCFLVAQESLIFVAEQDTTANNWDTGGEFIIRAGDTIISDAAIAFWQIYRFAEQHHLIIGVGEPGNRYWVLAKHFRPANTEDVFGEDIFIDYPMDIFDRSRNFGMSGSGIVIGDIDAMWVPHYYSGILSSKNRYKLLEIVPRLEYLSDRGRFWHEFTMADIQHGRAMFFNSAIRLGTGTHFAVRNIRKTEFGYTVECIISTLGRTFPSQVIFPESAFWNTYGPGDAVTLLLYFDGGDFLDIYVNSHDMLLGTFMRVGREFIAQYQSLILTNTADLTNVQWPRRAPKELNAGEEARVLKNLRLWENPDMESAVLSTLDRGSMVTMLEIGGGKTVDSVTAPWVQAETGAGEIGWVFGLYLREVTNEPMLTAEAAFDNAGVSVEIAVVPQADSVVESGGGMPPLSAWVWLAVAGGLAAVGGAVLAVRRKK